MCDRRWVLAFVLTFLGLGSTFAGLMIMLAPNRTGTVDDWGWRLFWLGGAMLGTGGWLFYERPTRASLIRIPLVALLVPTAIFTALLLMYWGPPIISFLLEELFR